MHSASDFCVCACGCTVQVLEDVSRCYCVVLHAVLDMHDDAAADSQQADLAARLSRQTRLDSNGSGTTGEQHPQAAPQHHTSNGNASSSGAAAATQQQSEAGTTAPAAAPARHSSTDESASSTWQIGTHKRTLFAGYVSFQQIQDFMDSSSSSRNGRSLLDSWLKGPKAPLKDKVVMTGPGGMGRCEVAVTKMEQPPATTSGSSSSSSSLAAQQGPLQRGAGQQAAVPGDAQQLQQPQGQGQGLLQRGLQRARVVASGVQQALDVLSELQPSPAASHMLCALMTLRLPVHFLARELLAAV